MEKQYICIDLKTFYASVECVERGLDPLRANLVVADKSRTEKTICLAVSTSMKALGIPGRARLFEVVRKVNEVNAQRKKAFGVSGASYDALELKADGSLSVDYIVAVPQMALYMKYSKRIYEIYLRYISYEDIHVYSIDEVFIDATNYLATYNLTARELVMKMIGDVLRETGITATAGIGTNMYLAKIAMDIEAKKMKPDREGVRIAELDEMSYRRKLWNHRPLTDFWRVGKAYEKKLNSKGIYTMGDIARCSIGEADDFYNEDLLYKMFGVNAELLIDHAWGWEPCTIKDIKSYKPASNSISAGQVMHCATDFETTRLIVREMADTLSLDLADKGFVTNQLVLTIGYDVENLTDSKIRMLYSGEITTDFYGRKVPKHAHGTENLGLYTSSSKRITEAAMVLYDRIINTNLLSRRINITANHVIKESEIPSDSYEQLDFFGAFGDKKEQQTKNEAREKSIQNAIIGIKKKYGKNAVVKGMNMQEGATEMERNNRIGGHKM